MGVVGIATKGLEEVATLLVYYREELGKLPS
jgi:hypothetical protein